MTLAQFAIAVGGGFIAGGINTLAGNGSAITLTILTEVLGLSPNVANGTNRIGVFTQSAAASRAFWKHGMLDLRRDGRYIALITLGAILGVWTATQVSNEQFRTVFSWLMVVMLVVILVDPKRWLRETEVHRRPPMWLAVPLFLALGFYGGFIQMGMGVFFLAVMVLGARYSLMDANAVKAFVIALYTIIVIAIFQYRGLIDWKVGFVMALGQTAGGWLTAHYAGRWPRANVWAHRLLVVMVLLAVAKLFGLLSW